MMSHHQGMLDPEEMGQYHEIMVNEKNTPND
jgi:hypothetical protein